MSRGWAWWLSLLLRLLPSTCPSAQGSYPGTLHSSSGKLCRSMDLVGRYCPGCKWSFSMAKLSLPKPGRNWAPWPCWPQTDTRPWLWTYQLFLPPGFGNSPDSDAVKTDQHRVDLLGRFMEALGVRTAVLLSPSMSGHYSIPFLMKHSAQLHGFIPIAPVGTRSYTPQQYQGIQTPTLIVFGALDTNLGAQSHKNLMQLPHHSVLKMEGARHACYMDKPWEFHQALLDFLSKLE
ncbi:abhydrolase domain-containing protein 14A isoform X3 [Salmo salar]|uniref:Abhydrolase domain-containing protein 14A isoform X3 n=1 Tax=Salmo salar TaxID=8030 RepID=A0A1S3P5Q2_SALSA|nr:abhydrolase domain-containing protein 14A isoform X3 [Salmo salar]|eukprot:XP_014022926.1 PREDICTED: abhydrolase domain-containing protein 14A isoform X2 [Salmo salar]